MTNTNTNTKPQSAGGQWEELAAAMFREYTSAPEGESYAEIRQAIEYARRSILPALTERDALRERVAALEGALLEISRDPAAEQLAQSRATGHHEAYTIAGIARAALRGQS